MFQANHRGRREGWVGQFFGINQYNSHRLPSKRSNHQLRILCQLIGPIQSRIDDKIIAQETTYSEELENPNIWKKVKTLKMFDGAQRKLC